MAITAETFEPEHFERILRGVQVACEAYGKVRKELEELEDAEGKEIENLKDELAEKPTQEEWDKLVAFIDDVRRGVRDFPELFAYVEAVR